MNRFPKPKDLRGRALKFAQGYDRLKHEAADLLSQAPVIDGQPRGSGTGDPTAAAAIRREKVMAELDIIEGALDDTVKVMGESYRQGLLLNVCYGVRAGDLGGYCEKQWQRARREFLIRIIERAGWV